MKNLLTQYLGNISDNYKIIDIIDGHIQALVIDYKNLKKLSSSPNFSNENVLYFLINTPIPQVNLEYLLNCRDETLLNNLYTNNYKTTLSQIYIGKTCKPISRGFPNHHTGTFDYMILFISKIKTGFSSNEIKYLENYYYKKYNNTIYNVIKNKTTPPCTPLSIPEDILSTTYIENIDFLLSIIDNAVFPLNFKLFSLSSKGVNATAYIINDNFTIVTKGSEAVKDVTPNSIKQNKPLVSKRESLINSGVLTLVNSKYIFTQDYIFSSKSGAVECILGNSRSGTNAWKICKF